jgi:glutathione S-transferase
MPFPPRVFHRQYLKKNVLGTIPFFEDGDISMTESCGIPQYLVTKYGPSQLCVTPDEPDYAAYLNWLFHADATLTFPQTVVLRYTFQEPGVADAAAVGYAKWYVLVAPAWPTETHSDSLPHAQFHPSTPPTTQLEVALPPSI